MFTMFVRISHTTEYSTTVKGSNKSILQRKLAEIWDSQVFRKFNRSGISTVDMLQYMLNNDINNWIHYYAYTFIIPVAKGEEK